MDLKAYFHEPYQGGESFINNVILPIFGEDKYDDAYEEDVIDNNPELERMAESTGISQILRLGTIDIPMNPTDVFDITVNNRVQMERNRVAIQMLIRRIMSTYSSAFMVFHYNDTNKWDWRFSFCSKQGNNSETTDSKRYTFLLGPNQSCRTATENFNKLAEKTGKIELDDIVKAFDVEVLSKEFFDKYKHHYECFCEYVYDNKDNTECFGREFSECEDKIIRDYVKKLLGRIVFLHFLQKKGWMGVPADKEWGEGDLNFMRNLFNNASQSQKENFLDKVLKPLFEKGLDTDRTANNDLFNTGVEGFKNVKIPYLNGGLFEKDALDKPKARFSAQLFDDLLEFFYEYNFTIDENDPNDAQVGVDPEMLGRIFENLLEDNKDKGAFYTPKEIVQYMCKESLIAYLLTDVKTEETQKAIRTFVTTYDVNAIGGKDSATAKYINEYLKNVKICDPAIGSGAFPMGMLKELFFCRGAIENFDDAAEIKRHIIQQNIYGVDIEKGAVDIARLRFWLGLIVDEKTPHALPNLDFKIMQGNSLLESYEGMDLSLLSYMSDIQIYEPQRNLFGELEDSQIKMVFTQSDKLKDFQTNLKRYFEVSSHDERALLRKKIDDYIKDTITYTLDTHKRGEKKKIEQICFSTKLSDKQKKSIAVSEAYIAHLEKVIENVKDMELPNSQFFLWHTYFKDVFDKGGFDIVIGNPPYVEAKKLKHIANTLKGIYAIYSGTADLSVYFNELGLNILADNGILSYITTNKFFLTGYGEKVRKLLSSYHINMLLNFEQVEVFEGILVSSVILNIIKRSREQKHLFTYERFYKLKNHEFKQQFVERLNSFGEYPQDFLNEKEWAFADMKQLMLKDKIEKKRLLLKDVEGVNIFRGVTTGYNPAFIISNEQRDKLIKEDNKNNSIIKNMLQGRNIRKWYYNESDENLIFTRRGTDIEKYPIMKKYLYQFYNQLKPKKHSDDLEGRKPGTYKWFEILDNTAYYPHFEKSEKIIWGLTADKWAYTLDTEQHFLPSNAYILTSDTIPIRYILGLLNSKLLHYYFGFIGVMTAGGAYTLKAATIEALPMVIGTQEQQKEIASKVDSILNAKAKDKQMDVSSIEHEIDLLVYDLYGLTPEEIAIVEGTNKE